LKELTHAGLISQERQGRNLIYRASFATMNELLGYLTDNCCQGSVCLSPGALACDC
jgi:ArsR family transcriptional regulator, arsenate/arsenite/antimonite-responsive transcriptional repressor